MLKYFYSMKTALILMTLIIILSIIGTFQADGAIYHSYLYQGLSLLLIINTLLCTGRRIPQILLKIGTRNLTFHQVRKEFPKGNEINIPKLDSLIAKLDGYYHNHRYRVISLKDEGEEIIYAKKGVIALIANQVIHWALIIVFTGAFIGSFGRTAEVSGGIGQVADLSTNLVNHPFQIRIDDFNTLYNPDQSVKNWVTHLTIIDGKKELAKGTTKVNHPFQFQDVTFYQSEYGYQCGLEVNQNGMTKEFQIPLNQYIKSGNQAFMLEKNESGRYALKVYDQNRKYQTYELRMGKILQLPRQTSLKLLRESAFTVLKVKTDPGNSVVMIGLVIGALGFILLYTGQYREIKVLVHHPNHTARISIQCKNNLLREELRKEVLTIVGS